MFETADVSTWLVVVFGMSVSVALTSVDASMVVVDVSLFGVGIVVVTS